jgi:lipoyl(octanoyl) transferase
MYRLIMPESNIRYDEGLKMQQKAYELVAAGEYDGIIFILEHKPVFTVGANGGFENILVTVEELKKKEIDLVKINRGGNITFHGPGQIVAYPILNLNKHYRDVHWYVSLLEDVVINTLSEYNIEGYKKPEYRGVWVGDKKISAVGVHMKKWISTHGLSLNVNVDKAYFKMINPCGITEFGVTSMEDYQDNIKIADIKYKLIENFEKLLKINLTEGEIIESW